jgi:outer membrane protein insertion porin family
MVARMRKSGFVLLVSAFVFSSVQGSFAQTPTEPPGQLPAPPTPAPTPTTAPLATPAPATAPPPTPAPAPTTPALTAPPPSSADAPPADPGKPAEPQVLVAEVRVKSAKGDPLAASLEEKVYSAIRTRPGQTTTRSLLQQDINAVFATGYFSDVKATPEDTSIGVRVTFDVAPNPVLEGVSTEGTTLLPEQVVTDTFKDQVGQTLNFGQLQKGVKSIEEWYAERGFVLAKVSDVQSSPNGKVKLIVTEGVIEDIRVKGNTRTRDFIVTRELSLKPGTVFNRTIIQRDLQRVFGLGIFKDASLDLAPGQQDPQKVIVSIKIEEKNTGSIAAGAGINSAYGFFGTLSLQEQNFGGNNQKVGFDVQGGGQILLFNLGFTDPWIAGDPDRTSVSVNLFNRQSFSYVFNGGNAGVGAPGTIGQTPRENRLGLGVVFGRPLDNGWRASVGARAENIQLRDSLGTAFALDTQDNPLTISGNSSDNLFFLQAAAIRDTRDNPSAPRTGSSLRLSTDQSLPFPFLGTVLFNRPTVAYSQFIPVDILPWGKGKQVFAFNSTFGSVFGDLPPYEAFNLGGGNSVRGYLEGSLATGRSFLIQSAELRFPVFDPVGAAIFADYGTDLGSAGAVLGAPGIVRGRPGSGLGIGAGVRVQSPLGALRIDYAFNSIGTASQVHFGLGEKF